MNKTSNKDEAASRQEYSDLLKKAQSEVIVNEAANSVDRHRTTWRRHKVALYWEGKNGEEEKFTFDEISNLSNKFANILAKRKIKKGEVVMIFLPRVPYAYIGFLAAVKAGAIACCLFSAFGEDGLFDRLEDSGARIILTNTELKSRVDAVIGRLPNLKQVIVVDSPEFEKDIASASADFAAVKMEKDDGCFIVYTSGSTGKPKGVVHTHGGGCKKDSHGKVRARLS